MIRETSTLKSVIQGSSGEINCKLLLAGFFSASGSASRSAGPPAPTTVWPVGGPSPPCCADFWHSPAQSPAALQYVSRGGIRISSLHWKHQHMCIRRMGQGQPACEKNGGCVERREDSNTDVMYIHVCTYVVQRCYDVYLYISEKPPRQQKALGVKPELLQ